MEVGGRQVRITSPEKVLFPERGLTKLDVVGHFAAVAGGVLRGVRERPTVMHRFPGGPGGESFFQKRLGKAPEWVDRVAVRFPAGGEAVELCPTQPAHVLWAANLGCLELHPWQVRRRDLLRPDELRFDLDPAPGVPFDAVRAVGRCLREVLADAGLEGFPKTTGQRGLHVHVRIEPRWGYLPVRRAVLAVAREVERRVPHLATSSWWKEDRGERVLIDFNQNLPDRTVTAPYSVRPRPDAPVACPIRWEELDDVDPRELTIGTVAERFAARGDPMARLDEHGHSIEALLEWVARDEERGLGEAPFPPHFPKVPGEPARVHPSRARRARP